MKYIHLAAALVACLAGGSAMAAPPDAYSMLNGNSGSFNYWDQIYNGAGCVTCDNAPLSGGTGDLTDGVIAANNWFIDEAPPGNGPYVGWALDPTITFHWNSSVNVNAVTFHFDDSDGAGGVSAPGSVIVNGSFYAIAEPAGPAPFSFTASGVGFSGTDLVVSIQRKNSWVFLSEVTFDIAPAIPEPETYALMLAGLGVVAMVARRRKA